MPIPTTEFGTVATAGVVIELLDAIEWCTDMSRAPRDGTCLDMWGVHGWRIPGVWWATREATKERILAHEQQVQGDDFDPDSIDLQFTLLGLNGDGWRDSIFCASPYEERSFVAWRLAPEAPVIAAKKAAA